MFSSIKESGGTTIAEDVLDRVHGDYVHKRRAQVLSALIADLLPQNVSVLDVGCGDGYLSSLIVARRPDVRIHGIDVLVRPHARIPVTPFDGTTIPCDGASVDLVMFVDVLHHTNDPMILLRESARVARQGVIVKDHNREGFLGGRTLHFMDWIGNARHGVALPYNYWTPDRWDHAFHSLGFTRTATKTALGLYPAPVDWIFGRDLHFLARLEKTSAASCGVAQAA